MCSTVYFYVVELIYMFKKYLLIRLWLFFILAGLLVQWLTLRVTNSSIYDNNNVLTQKGYSNFRSNSQDSYSYIIDLKVNASTNRTLQVYPNDCILSLEINNVDYIFDANTNTCDTWFGVTMKLNNYLKLWSNTLNFKIKQNGKGNTFVIKPSIHDFIRQISICSLLIGFFCVLLYLYKKHFTFSSPRASIVFFALIAAAYFLWSRYIYGIDYFQWTHDLIGHLDHLRVILRGDWLPRANLCRECYHPPLFYWAMAICHEIAHWFSWIDPMEFVRVVTYFLFHLGIVFAVRLLYHIFYKTNAFAFWLSLLLLLFRPTNFIYGGRVMNDVGFYATSFFFLYFAYQFYNNIYSKRYLVYALFAFWVGLLTKSNTIIWLPLIGLPFAIHYFSSTSIREHVSSLRKQYTVLGIWLLIIIWSLTLVNILKSNAGIVGNADRLTNELSVKHIPLQKTFLDFNYHKFIYNTSTYTFNDSGERGLFWNFLAKTMITWEMDVTQSKNTLLFPYIHFLFLFLAITAIYYFFKSRKEQLFFVMGFVIPLIAMMLFRVQYPFGSSMHYRYIFPHLLFFIYFLVQGLSYEKLRDLEIFSVIRFAVIVVFLLLSIVFSVPPYF